MSPRQKVFMEPDEGGARTGEHWLPCEEGRRREASARWVPPADLRMEKWDWQLAFVFTVEVINRSGTECQEALITYPPGAVRRARSGSVA